MEIFMPCVKEASLYREIAKNVINALEIIREAISNSQDAEAKNISINVYRNEYGVFCISIEDDGIGMSEYEMASFFNLGDSNKNCVSIGEKGLGTKTYFKSDKVIVITQKGNDDTITSVVNKPWDSLLNNEVPCYSIERSINRIGMNGTKIIIEGYKVDNPEKYYNYETLKDYILWFTAGGSFKAIFAGYTELHNYVKNMQVAPRIFICDDIQQIKKEIAGVHRFFPPNENPEIDKNEVIYKRSVNFCKHIGPFYKSTNINGEYVSFQIYGTISGVNCRKSICRLRQCETLKRRFGIYLAKDFIPIVKKSSLMTEPNYHHFHIVVNSQSFDLTADRNNISNAENQKVKWIYREVKEIISEQILPIAQETYFKLRKEEELLYQIEEKNKILNERLNNYGSLEDLDIEDIILKKVPDNESQVAILLTNLLSNNKLKRNMKYIEAIGHYSHQSTTDMICIDSSGAEVLVEVEYKLSNLFRHEHPYATFDYIVCWKVDIEENEKRKLVDGTMLKLVKINSEWLLKYGTEKCIPIIELKKVMSRL